MPHRLSSTALVFGGEFITSNRINKVIVCFFLTLHIVLYTSSGIIHRCITSYQYLYATMPAYRYTLLYSYHHLSIHQP